MGALFFDPGSAMAEEVPRKSLGIVSMLFGIVGAVFIWIMVVNLICGTLAIVLGVTALRRGRDNRGPAIAGLVLGIPPFITFWLVTIEIMSSVP